MSFMVLLGHNNSILRKEVSQINATYNYKTGRNNIEFAHQNSKKGTCKTFVAKHSASESFIERSLSFIDNLIDFLSSARTLVAAKALFAFITL